MTNAKVAAARLAVEEARNKADKASVIARNYTYSDGYISPEMGIMYSEDAKLAREELIKSETHYINCVKQQERNTKLFKFYTIGTLGIMTILLLKSSK